MAKKQFFAILDTETTIEDTVADLGIVICDRQGNIAAKMGVMVKDHFDTKELFYNPKDTGFWGKQAAERRRGMYQNMLNEGSRMMASVPAINRWIAKAIAQYNPDVTAYNLAFDKDKCAKTGIDLSMFKNEFCLWQAAVGNICHKKQFKQFVIENHCFNAPTESRNMTMQTNAEVVAGYLAGEFKTEPHTALEDAQDFELPILRHILKIRGWRDNVKPYNWREFQVKDHFAPR
jgi:hypothetical protein